MEACASAHDWGRAIAELGHTVRPVPLVYVKPFVKRQKNDATDTEAITEAASHPTMRFLVVKTEEQQARGMIFRTRDLLVRQRTQLINALRGHLAEHGVIVPQGPANIRPLADVINNDESSLSPIVRDLGAPTLSRSISSVRRSPRSRRGCVMKRRERRRRYGCKPCRGLGRSQRWPSKPLHPRWKRSNEAETSQHGSGSCRPSTRQAAGRGWVECRRWASVISVGC